MLEVDPHPLLAHAAFVTDFQGTLAERPSPDWLVGLLALDAPTPVARSEELRAAVRELLRHGGYRPTGRGKPASEYLVRAVGEGQLGPINLAVDACNVVSLASGLPVSVVDLERVAPPLRIAVAPEGTRYVFNAGGQEIDASGLLCLWDAEGPTANAVKDAQRTKTHSGTRRTLSVVWGVKGHGAQLERATAWYRELLERAGATTEEYGAR